MAFFEFAPSSKGFVTSLDTEKAIRAPIGAASPLWLAFAGVAGLGVAYWWMRRWMQPVNADAFLLAAPKAAPAPEPMVAPVAKLAAPILEPAPEPVPAPVIVLEPAPEPVAEVAPAPVLVAPKLEPAAPLAKAKPAPKAKPAAKPVAKIAPPPPAGLKIMTPSDAAKALTERRKAPEAPAAKVAPAAKAKPAAKSAAAPVVKITKPAGKAKSGKSGRKSSK
jgi:outer membrane biosynthesis protein TonB